MSPVDAYLAGLGLQQVISEATSAVVEQTTAPILARLDQLEETMSQSVSEAADRVAAQVAEVRGYIATLLDNTAQVQAAFDEYRAAEEAEDVAQSAELQAKADEVNAALAALNTTAGELDALTPDAEPPVEEPPAGEFDPSEPAPGPEEGAEGEEFDPEASDPVQS